MGIPDNDIKPFIGRVPQNVWDVRDMEWHGWWLEAVERGGDGIRDAMAAISEQQLSAVGLLYLLDRAIWAGKDLTEQAFEHVLARGTDEQWVQALLMVWEQGSIDSKSGQTATFLRARHEDLAMAIVRERPGAGLKAPWRSREQAEAGPPSFMYPAEWMLRNCVDPRVVLAMLEHPGGAEKLTEVMGAPFKALQHRLFDHRNLQAGDPEHHLLIHPAIVQWRDVDGTNVAHLLGERMWGQIASTKKNEWGFALGVLMELDGLDPNMLWEKNGNGDGQTPLEILRELTVSRKDLGPFVARKSKTDLEEALKSNGSALREATKPKM